MISSQNKTCTSETATEVNEESSHSEVMGWVRARMAFAILRATNLCLR